MLNSNHSTPSRFLLSLMLLGALSCTNDYVQTFEYQYNPDLNTTRQFKASSDASAFLNAYDAYCGCYARQKAAQGPVPTSFSLVLANNNEVISEGVVDSTSLETIFIRHFSISRAEYRAKEEERIRQQRILRAQADSIARIAWGDVLFGMSKKEVNASSQFRGMKKVQSFNDNWRYVAPASTNASIVKAFNLYAAPKLYAEFNGADYDELIEIELESQYKTASSFYALIHDCREIASFLRKTYGEPKLLNLGLESYDVKSGDLVDVARWDNWPKSIWIYIYETHDFDYKYVINIKNSHYPTTRNTDQEAEKEKKAKDAELLQQQMF